MAQRNPNTLSPARRFGIRAGLATGATITALLGAQTLAFMDGAIIANDPAEAVVTTNDTALNNFVPTYTATPVDQAAQAPSLATVVPAALEPAAPQLTIVRNEANTPSQVSAVQPTAVQPTIQPTATQVPTTVVAPAQPTAQKIVPPAVQSTTKQTRPRTRSSR
ncbi:MAG: hypothetical protein IT324_01985 [Anaerolineae bacterium]|nr:hypothetical protein [Anaerolineae bacterium]